MHNGFCLKAVTHPSTKPARPELNFKDGLFPVAVLG